MTKLEEVALRPTSVRSAHENVEAQAADAYGRTADCKEVAPVAGAARGARESARRRKGARQNGSRW
eukprot:2867732-Pleurochrysis_carterae.AAC.1